MRKHRICMSPQTSTFVSSAMFNVIGMPENRRYENCVYRFEDVSVCSITWHSLIFCMGTRSIIPHVSYENIGNVVEYRPVSYSMSSTNLKTGTLRITTM